MPEDTPQTPAGSSMMSVETPEAVSFSYELADVGSRGLALLVDVVLLQLIVAAEAATAFAVWWLLGLASEDLAAGIGLWIGGGTLVVVFLTVWGYFILAEGLRGRTYGKRRLGLRVIRDDGGRATMLDSVVRNVLRLVDVLPGYFAVGLISALLTQRHRRVGDMAAGTVVVRDSGELALYFEGGSDSRREVLVREFIARRLTLTPEGRRQVAVALLATYGEEPGDWDEPTIAGRLADLAGAR